LVVVLLALLVLPLLVLPLLLRLLVTCYDADAEGPLDKVEGLFLPCKVWGLTQHHVHPHSFASTWQLQR
jgi:hypothetical protein